MRQLGLRFASLAVAALALGGCDLDRVLFGNPEDLVEKRVVQVLETVSDVGNAATIEYQTAICLWWRDKYVINDSTEFNWAYTEFEKFKQAGSLGKGLTFEIEEIYELEPGPEAREFLVRGTINRSPFELIVPEKRPMRWHRAPAPAYG